MRSRNALLALALGLLATNALGQSTTGPPALELPVGARVRLRTQAAPGDWIKGVFAGADSGTIALVPDGAPPLGFNQLRLSRESVTRLEIVTGKKRQWLPGLLIGLRLGVGLGFAEDVDPVRCEFDDETFCTRAEAVAVMGGTSAAMGAGIGALVRRDVWVPVGLDALGSAAVARRGCRRRASRRARWRGARRARPVLKARAFAAAARPLDRAGARPHSRSLEETMTESRWVALP